MLIFQGVNTNLFQDFGDHPKGQENGGRLRQETGEGWRMVKVGVVRIFGEKGGGTLRTSKLYTYEYVSIVCK